MLSQLSYIPIVGIEPTGETLEKAVVNVKQYLAVFFVAGGCPLYLCES